MSDGKNLVFFTAIPVSGDALAPQFIGQVVNLSNILNGCIPWEVDCFGNRIVRVFLEGRLHADVPFGDDIVSRDKNALFCFRDFLDMRDASFLRHPVHQFGAVKSFVPCGFFEMGVYFDQLIIVHDSPDKAEGEQRFYAARTFRNDAQCAGRGNCGGRGISHGGVFHIAEIGCIVIWKVPSFLRQRSRGVMGFFLNEAHDLFRRFKGFLGIVGDSQLKQHVGKAHDAQSDFSISSHHLSDFRKRISGHFQGIVQKAHTVMDHLPQRSVIESRALLRGGDEPGQVNGAQIAGLHGKKRLFAARVGALNLSQVRGWIVTVDLIQKDDSRITILPGLFQKGVVNLHRLQFAHFTFLLWINEVIGGLLPHALHESVCYGNRYIKIIKVLIVFFAVDEFHDVRMVHPQDGHVSPPSSAPLLYLLGGSIKNLHERDGPGCDASCCPDPAPYRPQAGERKTGSAP